MRPNWPSFRYETDIVVIDLEASSPEERVNDVQTSNIIEIGAVRLDRRTLEIRDTFSELVKPRDHPIQPFIARMTGITPEMVASRDEFHAAGERFIAWYGPRNRGTLAAFGAYYDIPLLRKEMQAFGFRFQEHFVGAALDVRTLAVVWLAQHGISTSSITIAKIHEAMGLGDLGRGEHGLAQHRALDDALGAAAIFQFLNLGQALLGGAAEAAGAAGRRRPPDRSA